MKKREGVILIYLIGLIFLSSIICADIEVGNLSDSVQLIYGSSEILKGWINISIQGESSDTRLSDYFDDDLYNETEIIDILRGNVEDGYLGSADYSCSTKNCSAEYYATNGEEEKTFSLAQGEKKIIGVKVTGGKVTINNVSFNLESSAETSCSSQLEIDIGDESAKVYNYKASALSCEGSISYGCFEDYIESRDYNLKSGYFYCQNIVLSPYPGFKVGAWVQKINGTEDVIMTLKNKLGTTEYGSCNISNSLLSESGSEVGCQINYSVKTKGNYSICVTKTDGAGELRVKGYSTGASEYCGYYSKSSSGGDITSAYQIFAEGKKYASVGKISFANNISSPSISSAMNTYISKTYKNSNCSNGCVVPIEIKSNIDQNIELTNLNLKYSLSSEGDVPADTEFYDVTKTNSLVYTDGFIRMYLNPAEFMVPEDIGNSSLTLTLGSTEILDTEIAIQSIPKIRYILPDATFSAYPTKFTVYANASSGAISSYIWKFSDDNINTTTTVNNIIHTFNQTGDYTLTIIAKDSAGRSATKKFTIEVDTPEEMISQKYSELENRFNYINNQLSSYPTFIKTQVYNTLGLEEISEKLDLYYQRNKSADTLEEKNNVLIGLLNLSIPSSISTSSQLSSLTFFPKEENINLEVLNEVENSEYDGAKESDYREAILAWQQENLELKLDNIEINANYDQGSEHKISYFKITSTEKGEESYSPYFFVKKMNNFKFDQDPYTQEISGYYYSILSNPENEFAFTTTEDIGFLNLPVFVSPSISYLSISEEIESPTPEKPWYTLMNWWLFGLAVLFILIVGAVVYIILQEWYKNRYETYLFRGKNNMYNLINFIESQKKQGVDESEIENKLKKAGWNWEQIRYVTRKYSGKRTGMIEIPNPLNTKTPAKKPAQYPNNQMFPRNGANPYGMQPKKDYFKR